MKKARYFAPGAPQISARNLNNLVRTHRTGDNLVASGFAEKRTVHGVTTLAPRPRRPLVREPFEAYIQDPWLRKITVHEGICYVYGVKLAVDETLLEVDTTTTRVWVQFPITPGTTDEPTVEFGVESDLVSIDRNTHAFRVLAEVEIGGDDDQILSMYRRWHGGDVYFDD